MLPSLVPLRRLWLELLISTFFWCPILKCCYIHGNWVKVQWSPDQDETTRGDISQPSSNRAQCFDLLSTDTRVDLQSNENSWIGSEYPPPSRPRHHQWIRRCSSSWRDALYVEPSECQSFTSPWLQIFEQVVLGRPGSGCTTLLKTLANSREEYHAVEGDVFYDSISPEDLKNRCRGDVQYCSEEDIHFPSLTVDETLEFAAKSRAPHDRLGHTRAEYMKAMTDILTTVFGLGHARKTLIGDAVIRGISGGEKKRVSLAEVLATRSCVTAWDKSVLSISFTCLLFSFHLKLDPRTRCQHGTRIH